MSGFFRWAPWAKPSTSKTIKEIQFFKELPKVLLKFVSKIFEKQSFANILQNWCFW